METSSDDIDLLMDCEEEEADEEVLEAAVSTEEDGGEGGSDTPLVRIIPIPVHPEISPDTPSNTPTSSGAARAFMVNGRLVPLHPGGGATELKLCFHPGGSTSGFTSVQVPVTVTIQSAAGTRHITTTATLSSSTAPPPPPPPPDCTPIITGVVSGEAAQKVLSDYNVNFSTQTPQLKPSPPVSSPASPPVSPPVSPPCRPANKLPLKGGMGPISPPNCVVCKSQFKLIDELRGFMCLCSPIISWSLRNLKKALRREISDKRRKKKKKKRSQSSREPQTFRKVSAIQHSPSAPEVVSLIQGTLRPSDFQPEQWTVPASPTSPQQVEPEPAPAPEPAPEHAHRPVHKHKPPHSKLVIMVEDFYYGCDSRQHSLDPKLQARKSPGPHRCLYCPKVLQNNIKLMSHMQEHVSLAQLDEDMDSVSSCPHCFRHFSSPFRLQCHQEAVHSQCKTTAKCKICELVFDSEPAFLHHMKNTHKPGEMPYVCQVCDFRSSFYSDVWSHFQRAHANTSYLLCQYCLRVMRSSTCFQQHFARHQRKHVLTCDKCRLHFLYVKERLEHKVYHRTHIRPTQLTGLKPGTKVTVRTYSVVESESLGRPVGPCKVVHVDAAPPPEEPLKRQPRESLGHLLFSCGQESKAAGVSLRCVECLVSVQDVRSHFPSLVRCSLCRFTTCCSNAYANHMINDHAAVRKTPHYHSMFLSNLSLSQKLSCASCSFSTSRGDLMANHLSEQPQHRCTTSTHNEASLCDGEKLQPAKPPLHKSDGVTSSANRGGAFIPIHLLPSCKTSSQLSVKPLTSPCPLSNPPAMTIKFLGPRPQPEQLPDSSLSASQLSVLLFSLCDGVPQAGRRFQVSTSAIWSWMAQQEQQLSDSEWLWQTDPTAEWVLTQREQQRQVTKDMLLQTAKRVLGEAAQPADCCRWAVDFMLRHHLSMQPTIKCRRLPKNIRKNSHALILSLCSQIQSKALPPQSVAFMDELSVFFDVDLFTSQKPSALRLFGAPEETPLFDVVLCGTSDGTFLPPLLFFRGSPVDIPDDFPKNVLLEARQDGFTNRERLHVWTNKVWHPHVASHSRSLLMVDVHRDHQTDEFQSSLSVASTDVVFIPAGCCCRLQPLDVCVTPVLREFLQARWTQLVHQGGLEGLSLDQLALTMACWLSEVSFTLNQDMTILHRSFASVCHLQEKQEQAAKLIQSLMEMLIQPLEIPDPLPPLPGEPLQLLLVMEDQDQDG